MLLNLLFCLPTFFDYKANVFYERIVIKLQPIRCQYNQSVSVRMQTCIPLVFILNMCLLINEAEKGKLYIVETKDKINKLILSKALNHLKDKTGSDYQDILLQPLEGSMDTLPLNIKTANRGSDYQDLSLNTKIHNTGSDYQDIQTMLEKELAQNASRSDEVGILALEPHGPGKPHGGSLDECEGCVPGGGWGPWSPCYEDIPGARAIREKTCVKQDSRGQQMVCLTKLYGVALLVADPYRF